MERIHFPGVLRTMLVVMCLLVGPQQGRSVLTTLGPDRIGFAFFGQKRFLMLISAP